MDWYVIAHSPLRRHRNDEISQRPGGGVPFNGVRKKQDRKRKSYSEEEPAYYDK